MELPSERESPKTLSEKDEETPGESGFVSWQKTTRQHLGATINLILTLTIAATGFAASLLFKKEGESVQLDTGARWAVFGSLAILIIAVFWGLLVNLTRLLDFRWTTRSARLRELRDRFETPKGEGSPMIKPLKPVTQLPSWVDELIRKQVKSTYAAVIPRREQSAADETKRFEYSNDVLNVLERDVERLKGDDEQQRLKKLYDQLAGPDPKVAENYRRDFPPPPAPGASLPEDVRQYYQARPWLNISAAGHGVCSIVR